MDHIFLNKYFKIWQSFIKGKKHTDSASNTTEYTDKLITQSKSFLAMVTCDTISSSIPGCTYLGAIMHSTYVLYMHMGVE